MKKQDKYLADIKKVLQSKTYIYFDTPIILSQDDRYHWQIEKINSIHVEAKKYFGIYPFNKDIITIDLDDLEEPILEKIHKQLMEA
jgi:hypothetical protein